VCARVAGPQSRSEQRRSRAHAKNHKHFDVWDFHGGKSDDDDDDDDDNGVL
jgi:hypothetical protein